MVLILLLGGCTTQPRDTAPILTLEGHRGSGEARFQMDCATCHGATGAGMGQTPALSQIHRFSDAELADIIVNGRGAMIGRPLDDQLVADVVTYLRERFPAP